QFRALALHGGIDPVALEQCFGVFGGEAFGGDTGEPESAALAVLAPGAFHPAAFRAARNHRLVLDEVGVFEHRDTDLVPLAAWSLRGVERAEQARRVADGEDAVAVADGT